MSKKQDSAMQDAFEKGQADFREGKNADSNPYPPQAPYHDQWEQGWQREHDVHFK